VDASSHVDGRSARAGLLVLALAAFAAVTTEMLLVGLLPVISQEFDRSESATGLLVSLYAALVMLLAVPMTLATRRFPGKRVLLITMAGYCLSNLVCALAPSFGLFAAARGLGGLTHAVFFSVLIGHASRLVPAAGVGRALALVSAGPSAALILGSPLATAIGDAAGWRMAFGALVLLTLVTFALLATILPAAEASPEPSGAAARGGRRRDAVTVIAANALAYLGQFTLYTYVSVILLRSGASQAAVAPLLFLFGVFGLAGIWRAAPLLDRDPRRAALMILTVVALGVLALGASIPSLVLVTISGVVWNAAFGPANSLFQSATIRTGAISPELAGAWINTTSNFGIAAGALLGGIVLDRLDVHALAWVGALPTLLALVLVAVNGRGFAGDRVSANTTRRNETFVVSGNENP
jgi:predicted MFS family arabinose efflux permease